MLRLLTECSAMIRNIQPRWHSDVLVECLEEYPTSLKILSVLIDSEAVCVIFVLYCIFGFPGSVDFNNPHLTVDIVM